MSPVQGQGLWWSKGDVANTQETLLNERMINKLSAEAKPQKNSPKQPSRGPEQQVSLEEEPSAGGGGWGWTLHDSLTAAHCTLTSSIFHYFSTTLRTFIAEKIPFT